MNVVKQSCPENWMTSYVGKVRRSPRVRDWAGWVAGVRELLVAVMVVLATMNGDGQERW